MSILSLIIAVTLSALLSAGLAVFFITRQNAKSETPETEKMFRDELTQLKDSLQQQVLNLSQTMNQQMESQARFIQNQQQGYQQSFGHVENRLGQLQEATKRMVDIGKDISSLQSILKAPKMRGGLGELLLEDLLRQILPEENYSTQYRFNDGKIVDAVIHLCEGMIPIDAKFPLENFKKLLETSEEQEQKQHRKLFLSDVKKHIDHITSKYILPNEGTFEFARM